MIPAKYSGVIKDFSLTVNILVIVKNHPCGQNDLKFDGTFESVGYDNGTHPRWSSNFPVTRFPTFAHPSLTHILP